jgi:3-oxoacyl-[acyl-carrier-protein] synthase-3
VLKGIGTYHPKKELPNSFFINHFNQMGVDVKGLLSHLGHEKRYFAEKGSENVITMASQAANRALEKAKLTPKDIDMIVFATDTPEYLCPSNALLLNDSLKADNANIVFDINSNCIGMLTGMEVASRMLMGNQHLKRALVAGSMFASLIANKNDPVVYSNFADSGAAVILEKVEENKRRGFLDSNFKTDTFVKEKFLNPRMGMSKIYDDIPLENKKFTLDPFDTSFIANEWFKLINGMLDRNNMTVDQVKQFFFSQFSQPDAETTLRKFNLPVNKHTFVGNKYGYTGVTSPILALNQAMRHNILHEGDKIIFCSVGAGYNICSILFQL